MKKTKNLLFLPPKADKPHYYRHSKTSSNKEQRKRDSEV
jgi:hypothetical protein